jgi:hypothetical protein
VAIAAVESSLRRYSSCWREPHAAGPEGHRHTRGERHGGVASLRHVRVTPVSRAPIHSLKRRLGMSESWRSPRRPDPASDIRKETKSATTNAPPPEAHLFAGEGTRNGRHRRPHRSSTGTTQPLRGAPTEAASGCGHFIIPPDCCILDEWTSPRTRSDRWGRPAGGEPVQGTVLGCAQGMPSPARQRRVVRVSRGSSKPHEPPPVLRCEGAEGPRQYERRPDGGRGVDSAIRAGSAGRRQLITVLVGSSTVIRS